MVANIAGHDARVDAKLAKPPVMTVLRTMMQVARHPLGFYACICALDGPPLHTDTTWEGHCTTDIARAERSAGRDQPGCKGVRAFAFDPAQQHSCS